MNLALLDIRHNAGRFVATSFGVGLLFTVVLAMAGIYKGLVADATELVHAAGADLWVVQQQTRGPFADVSRLDPSVERRVAALPGVRRARGFTFLVLQRDLAGRSRRFALVGLGWPDDRGADLPLIAGRSLRQAHGELIVDASLGLAVGTKLELAREEFLVVGLTRQLLSSGGDAVIAATVADAQLITEEAPSDAIRTERFRRAERLRTTDLGRTQPALAALIVDPSWRPPVAASAPLAAVLVDLQTPIDSGRVRAALASWPDVSVYTTAEQDGLLLDGVVEKPRRQLALFALILIVTSSVLIAAVVYMMTLDKTHDLAVLKLIGARRRRIAAMVVQQAWLMGMSGYAIAVLIGSQAFSHFPRRVVLSDGALAGVGALVMVVSTLASLLGVAYALRVDAARALEG